MYAGLTQLRWELYGLREQEARKSRPRRREESEWHCAGDDVQTSKEARGEGGGKIGSLKMTGIGGAVRKSERNSLARSLIRSLLVTAGADCVVARHGTPPRLPGMSGIMGTRKKRRGVREEKLLQSKCPNWRVGSELALASLLRPHFY